MVDSVDNLNNGINCLKKMCFVFARSRIYQTYEILDTHFRLANSKKYEEITVCLGNF